MKCAFVVVQGKVQRHGIARYSKELQHRHAPPQACNSPCSVAHPVGDNAYELFVIKIRNLTTEWSGQLLFLGLTG
ncbi:MAG: hypothetical protein KZQ89_14930 [Candidatus Thiodiazotropha sp. (ex Lucinoma kastoroae)]|nr:hypothetical protein [Candidatus Thiodiazotropha sp. (ex Lucinoma kastoroae)]MCU7859122.1 hypothetical protein [Candidatus Thiodiazotropha sp. (ex Lucinoma kastoroae)]